MARTGIIIPTRARQPVLLDLISALLQDESLGEACIAVVCNGSQQDPEIVEALERLQRSIVSDSQRTLELTFLEAASKPQALNRGEETVGSCEVMIYCDDDIRITSGRMGCLRHRLLELGETPGLAAPRRALTPGCGWKERLFGSCVLRPPWVRNQVAVGGIFAVNRSGRSRWKRFPPIACDDEYVFSRFAHSERYIESECVTTHPFQATWRGILDQQRRWQEARQELHDLNLLGAHPGSHRTGSMLLRSLLDPRTLAGMALVRVVRITARWFGGSKLEVNGAWPEA